MYRNVSWAALAAAWLAAACSGGGGGVQIDTSGTACDGAFAGGVTRVVTDAAVVEFIPYTQLPSPVPTLLDNLDAGCKGVVGAQSGDFSTDPPTAAAENTAWQQLQGIAEQRGAGTASWITIGDRSVHDDVVGLYFVGTSPLDAGFFRYDGASGLLSLHPLPACKQYSSGSARINASGTVVGSYQDTSDAYHGFAWSDGTLAVIDLPQSLVAAGAQVGAATVPAIVQLEMTGLNDAGTAVGFAITAYSERIPFVYDVTSGSLSRFQLDPGGTLSGVTATSVSLRGITASGDVYGELDDRSGRHAYYQFAATGAVAVFDHPRGGSIFLQAGHADRIVLGQYQASGSWKPFFARVTAR